jgi:hypothetical protein
MNPQDKDVQACFRTMIQVSILSGDLLLGVLTADIAAVASVKCTQESRKPALCRRHHQQPAVPARVYAIRSAA